VANILFYPIIYYFSFYVKYLITSLLLLAYIKIGDEMIIIDAGHGGFDPGGGSNIYFKEKDKNLDISLYQYNRFKELGIPVILVRNNDETLNPNDRIERINSFKLSTNDILISNHINNGLDFGGEVIYSIRGSDTLPNLIANNLRETGLNIRNVYQKKGILGNDFYFILRDTIPNNAMIIEYGFATDELDTNRLVYNWQALAESVVKSISSYLQIPYTPPKYLYYVVKNNDSLYKIAQKFNTTIDSIKQLNNLKNDIIQVGTTLIIQNG
jgi:N-acetylmuramoyl-L-alanine amidase